MCGRVTFVMSKDASWNLELSTGREVAASWLEEEERLLGNLIIQFLHMVGVVSTYSHDLSRASAKPLVDLTREQ